MPGKRLGRWNTEDQIQALIDAGVTIEFDSFDWQQSVKDRFDPSGGLPPGVEGDRYLSIATANGWNADSIYEYRDGSWEEITPDPMMAVGVDDEGRVQVYTGGQWNYLGPIIEDISTDIFADDDVSQVLENGSNGTDAWFQGDLRASNGAAIVFSGSNRGNSYLICNVRANNGAAIVLDNGTDGTDAILIAEIHAEDDTVVLFNGNNNTNAWFKGDLRAENDDILVFSGTDLANSYALVDLRADVQAMDGTRILDNGADGTDGWFQGDIQADDTTQILENGTNGQDAWFKGDVINYDGTIAVQVGPTFGSSVCYAALWGDVYIDGGGAQVLENGVALSGTWFRGDILAENGTKIFENGTNGIDAWASLDYVEAKKIECIPQNSAVQGVMRTTNVVGTTGVAAFASLILGLSIPVGSYLEAVLLRVDSALAAGDTWDVAWYDGAATIQAIASNVAVAKNTKVQKFFDPNANSPITSTASTDLIITKNGGGVFTAQGQITAVAFYRELDNMVDAP